MKHKSISNQEEYDMVASRLEQLKDADAGTNEAEELKLLTRLIVEYEKRKYTEGGDGLE